MSKRKKSLPVDEKKRGRVRENVSKRKKSLPIDEKKSCRVREKMKYLLFVLTNWSIEYRLKI